MIERYLLDKKEWVRGLDVKPRDVSFPVTRAFVVAVVGPRRAGKSYSLIYFIRKRGLRDEEYLLLNFEEEDLKLVDRGELVRVVDRHVEIYGVEPSFIFLDEVQELDRWESFVYTLYERKRYFIFITGSSSRLLSREIATQLRGRALTYPVFPLSFKEVLMMNGISVKRFYSSREESRIKNLLRTYLRSGGFPQIVIDRADPRIYFRDYIDLVVYRDVVERYRIKKPFLVKALIKFVASSYSKEFSVNKVYNTLKSQGVRVSKKTLYKYSGYLEDAMFCFYLKKFDFSDRRIELSIPKVYLNDPGLANYLLSGPLTENIGRLMENIVFLELKKREFLGELSGVFYFKDAMGREVDFIVKEGFRVRGLVNVTYASSFDEVDEREWKNLLKASKLLGCDNLLVVTWDYEDQRKLSSYGRESVIRFIPLWKWLLSPMHFI